MQKEGLDKEYSSMNFLVHNRKPLLFLALLFYLYFRGIGDHGLLDPIEGVNASVPLTMLAGGGGFVPRVGNALCAGKAMGTWWLSAVSLGLLGWGEFSVRFWPALAGLGMTLAAVLAVKPAGTSFRTRRCWLTASVSAGTTLGFAVSQIASSHALYACCMGFVMAAFVRIGNQPLSQREERGWILLAHAASLAAFIVHGPEGILLPWLALLFFSVMTGHSGTLTACMSWWPATVLSLAGTAGYLLLLWLQNPLLLRFMFYESPKFLAPDGKLVLAFLLMGTIPWPGFLIRAVWEAIPRDRDSFRSDWAGPDFFIVFWMFFFGLFALLMGDLLALGACVPALAALVGAAFDRWLEAEAPGDSPADVSPLQIAVALNILILTPLILAGIPLAVKGFPLLKGALLSLVPWGLFVMIFLFASWHYARRTREPEAWYRKMPKLARNGSVLVLLCLMPLAGVFDLAAVQGGIRPVGLTLRGAVSRGDTIIQYGVHRPSLFFYTLHDYVLLHSPQLPGVVSGEGIRDDTALHNLWRKKDRAFLLIRQDQRLASPLPDDVHSVAEAGGMLLLSNRSN
ncbi:MAG: hypothetical protein K6E38_09225 [Fretibacterium sp.]|nr:hypothetical protein [Fretibacterium sp.]